MLKLIFNVKTFNESNEITMYYLYMLTELSDMEKFNCKFIVTKTEVNLNDPDISIDTIINNLNTDEKERIFLTFNEAKYYLYYICEHSFVKLYKKLLFISQNDMKNFIKSANDILDGS